MAFRNVSTGSVQSHLRSMLEELAELADTTADPKLDDIALRLRLIAGDPALRSQEHDFDEVLLSCDRTGLRLIKCWRVSGATQLMPTYRLECPDGCPDALCDVELDGERSATQAFMRAKASLMKAH